ncbi:MAG: penicillin-binding protein 2 [Candidatus Margulisbacteria bacterium]|nr:penicillin-binding protein 2 [Candidatus Margulisiibacteriota bacterium]
MFWLQVIRYDFFKDQSKAQQKRKITIYPNRGDIRDRNGVLLASSSKAYSVYLDPRYKKKNPALVLKEMRDILGLSADKSEHLLAHNSYILVKTKVDKPTALKLTAKGFDLLPDSIRTYPGKRTASQLIGFVGWDNDGKDGLEKAYDKTLAGKSGFMILESDLKGRVIFSDKKKISPVKDGNHIETTIDKYLQFILEVALERGVENVGARSASGVIMDVYTGEIYAMGSYPAFDPNDYSPDFIKDPTCFWNRAIFMDYEPGSVMKLFTIAAALEEGVIKDKDKIYSPNRLVVDNSVIEEAHDAQVDESLTKDVSEIIIKSLNVGAATIGLNLGAEKLYKNFIKFGFGRRTGIELPGESPGSLRHFSNWYKVDLSRMAFGYGLTATPLQLVRAVAVFANGGDLVQPYIIKGDKGKKEKILSKHTSAFMMEAMRRTVEEGTGVATRIDNFSIGGKTGTARLFSPEYNRYLYGQYNTTFLGVFPVAKPRFAMVIMVNDPRRMKYAASSAVPIFKEVTERAIRYLQLDPI